MISIGLKTELEILGSLCKDKKRLAKVIDDWGVYMYSAGFKDSVEQLKEFRDIMKIRAKSGVISLVSPYEFETKGQYPFKRGK